jgi:UDP-glucose 4-epimerase
LVTGATGFIGRAAVAALEHEGWEVVRGVRRTDTGGDVLEVDIQAPDVAARILRGPRFDAIVHLAARIGWDGGSLADLFVPNVIAVGHLLHVCQATEAHFVFASAAIVAGARANHITAESPEKPDTPYAESKLLAERLIAASGVRSTTLRIAGVFGKHGPTHLQLNRAIEGAMSGRCPQIVGEGRARRNYIYVKDLAEVIVHALDHKVEGTHLIAGSEAHPIRDMLRAVCEVFLPGSSPVPIAGVEADDQVVDPSPLFPASRGFRAALRDIKCDAECA